MNIIEKPKFIKVKGVKSPYNDFTYEVMTKGEVTRLLLFSNDYKKVLMIKQYRPGIDEEVWEFPAGYQEKDLSPEENVLKELKEETGYEKEDILDLTLLTSGYESPGVSDCKENIFYARLKKDAKKKKNELEENEIILEQRFFEVEEALEVLEGKGIKSAFSLLKFMKIKREKIAIFGGTFNPITIAHIRLAMRALEEQNLDRIIFEPVNDKYRFKEDILSYKERVKLIEMAIKDSGESRIEVGNFEGNSLFQPNTIDTLKYYREKYPLGEIYFICGSDNLEFLAGLKDYRPWSGAEEILGEFKLITLQREDENIYKNIIMNSDLLLKYRNNIKIIYELNENNISATKVRYAIKSGMSIFGLVTANVEKYIKENKLYL